MFLKIKSHSVHARISNGIPDSFIIISPHGTVHLHINAFLITSLFSPWDVTNAEQHMQLYKTSHHQPGVQTSTHTNTKEEGKSDVKNLLLRKANEK